MNLTTTFKQTLLLFCGILGFFSLSAQVVINEVQLDPGNGEAGEGEFIELFGPPGTDIGCYVIATDDNNIITLPAGSVIPASGYFLIVNAATTSGTSNSGSAVGTFNNTNAGSQGDHINYPPGSISLDVSTCNCASSGALGYDNFSTTSGNPDAGQRVVLFDNMGNIVDAVSFCGGNGNGTPGTGSCSSTGGTTTGAYVYAAQGTACGIVVPDAPGCTGLPSMTLPAVGDPAYENAACGVGCSTSQSRMTDGSTTWIDDNSPTPGLANNSPSATAVVSLAAGGCGFVPPVIPTSNFDLYHHELDVFTTNVSVCQNTPITFNFLGEMFNWVNINSGVANASSSGAGGNTTVNQSGATAATNVTTNPAPTVSGPVAATGITSVTDGVVTSNGTIGSYTLTFAMRESTEGDNGSSGSECYYRYVVNVTVAAPPAAPVAAASTPVCYMGPGPVAVPFAVTATLAAGDVVRWYDAATGGNLLGETTALTFSTNFTPSGACPEVVTVYAAIARPGCCESAVRTPVTNSIYIAPVFALVETMAPSCADQTATVGFSTFPTACAGYEYSYSIGGTAYGVGGTSPTAFVAGTMASMVGGIAPGATVYFRVRIAGLTTCFTEQSITVSAMAMGCCTAPSITSVNSCVGGGTVTFTQTGGTPAGDWSVDGGGTIDIATGVFTPTTPGCFNVTYTIAGGCTDTEPFVVYPQVPVLAAPANTCNAAFVLPVVPTVSGFTTEFSVDGGAFTTAPVIPTTPGCHTVTARYVLTAACGATAAGTPGAGACGNSNTASVVIFPSAPVLIAPANTCNAAFVLPVVSTVTGFTSEFSVDGGAFTATPIVPTTPGCHTVAARYVLTAACGVTLAGTAGTGACGNSNTVSVVIFPNAPVLIAPANTCNVAFVLPVVATVTGFTTEFSVDGGAFAAAPVIPTTPGCHTVTARYVLTAACGATAAGTAGTGACGNSNTVSVVIFPSAPVLVAPANTCNAAFVLPVVATVTGFTTQFSVDGGAFATAPVIPTTPGCHTVTARYVLTAACGATAAGTAGSGACGNSNTVSVVIFPNAPVLIAPANTCNAAFVLPVVATVTGFTTEFSVDGGAFAASPVIPTTPGCHTVTARYVLTAACDVTAAGTAGTGACGNSNTVSVVIFPSAPVLVAPVNTCNSAFVLPVVATVTGFTTQFSVDGGAFTAAPVIPTTPGCHTVTARYVLTAACGATAAGTAGSGACGNSNTVSVVIFPSAPVLVAPANTCNAAFVLPVVATVTGFTTEFSVDGGAFAAAPVIPTTPGCHTVTARYVLTAACGATAAGSAGTGACGNSNTVSVVIFPSAPVLVAPANTCNSAFVLPVVATVTGFTTEFSVDGGAFAAAPVIPTTPGCHTVTARYVLTAACGATAAGTAGSGACGNSNTVSVVIFPNAPVIVAPANTCASAFSLPSVATITGFTVEYSIDGGAFAATPVIPTTPGCHTISVRYVLTAACGGTAAGSTDCGTSNTVSVVIFPAAPVLSSVSNTCNGPLALPVVPVIAGFNIEYSIDGGAFSASPVLPSTIGCHTIQARYVLAADCGTTLAGTSGSGVGSSSAPVGGPVLNEVLFDATTETGTTFGEGWEIAGTPGTNIGCAYFTDGDFVVQLPSTAVIPADGFYVIGTTSSSASWSSNIDYIVTSTSIIPNLTNSGEYLAYFNASNAFVDGLVWGPGSGVNTPAGTSAPTVSLAGVGCPALPSFATIQSNVMAVSGSFGSTSVVSPGNEISIERATDVTGAWQQSALPGSAVNTMGATNGTVVAGLCDVSNIINGVVFPSAPVLVAPANTCASAFVLPAVAVVTGFTIEYSIDGGAFTTTPVIPTTPGCHSVVARYVLTAACGSTPAGSVGTGACGNSNTVSVVIFPTAPVIVAPANTCASAFVLPTVPTVTGFSIEYSIDGGAFAATPVIPTTPGCHSVIARYVLTAACGGTAAGSAGTGACGNSNTVNVVIFPAAPVIVAPANTCASAFVLPAVTVVTGFSVEYSVDGGAFAATPVIPTTPGCHSVVARYVLTAACGSTPAGTVGTGACGNSNTVNVVIFPNPPVIVAPANVCASAFALPAVTAVTGFTVEFSIDGGAFTATPVVPTTPGCHTITVRYTLTAACGGTAAGTTNCGTSNTVNVVIFPAAPVLANLVNTCNGPLALPVVPAITGFNIEYSVDGGAFTSSPVLPTTTGCHTIQARYVLAANCGSTLAGTSGSGVGSSSSPVGGPVLNEVLFDATTETGSTFGEGWEIAGTPGTNIGCSYFTDGDFVVQLPLGATIPADGFYVIGTNNSSPTWSANIDYLLTSTSVVPNLTNSGEYLAFFNASNAFVDGIVWGPGSSTNTPAGSSTPTVAVAGAGCPALPSFASIQSSVSASAGLFATTSVVSPGNEISIERATDITGSWQQSASPGSAVNTMGATNGTVAAGLCDVSNIVNGVVFPSAPVLVEPAATCASAFILPAVSAVTGFNIEFSIDGGAFTTTPVIPTTPGCHSITARYVLAAACGLTPAGTAGTGACGNSNMVNVAIFPNAPVIVAPLNTCAGPFSLPPVVSVVGFNIEFSVDGGAFSVSPTIPTTPGCHSIVARYVIAATCGSTAAGTNLCGTSNTVNVVIFPMSPVLTAPTNTCNSAFTLPVVPAVAGFTVEYSINGDAFSASPVIPTAVGCHTIVARYVLAANCGGTLAGTAGTGLGAGGIVPVGGPVINEVIFDATTETGTTFGEGWEIAGTPGLNIGCSYFTDGDFVVQIPAGATIPADGFYVIGTTNSSATWAPNIDLLLTSTSVIPNLTNSGEYLAYFNASNTFVDGVVWGPGSATNTPAGTSAPTAAAVGAGCPALPAFATIQSNVFASAASFVTVSVTSPGNEVSIERATDVSGGWQQAAAPGSTVNTMGATNGAAPTGLCGPSASVTANILPTPTVNTPAAIVVCNNETVTVPPFTSSTVVPACLGASITYSWTNNNTSIGLGASGTGNIPSFVAINPAFLTVQVATITVTPSITVGGVTCTGTPVVFTITVNPTPVPRFEVVKTVVSETEVACSPMGNVNVTFDVKVTNTGNITLNKLQLIDMLAANFGPAFVSIVTAPAITSSTATTNPTLNGAYNGNSISHIFAGSATAGTTGVLAINQMFTVRMTVQLNPNANCANPALVNRARALGEGFACNMIQIANNVSADVPFYVPGIAVSKQMDAFQCASNGCTNGNAQVQFTVKVKNIGNTLLTGVQVIDNLALQMGAAFAGVVPGSLYFVANESQVASYPVLNQGWNGTAANANLFTTGASLDPCDSLVVRFSATVNPALASGILSNQATATGTSLQINPGINPVVTDLSDSGGSPESTNTGAYSDTGCEDDVTVLCLPELTTLPQNLTVNVCDSWEGVIDNWLADLAGAEIDNACNTPICIVNDYYDLGSYWTPNGCGKNQIKTVRFTIKYVDVNGNMSEICFCANITLQDNTGPFFDMLPMNKTLMCGPNTQAMIQGWLDGIGGAWVSDCGSDITVTHSNVGNLGACGSSTVTFTATDACGMSTTASATITVVDAVAPIFTSVPSNVTINCPATPVFGTPTVEDACGTPVVTYSDQTIGGPCPAGYSVIRTWTVTDGCGNSATASATITVLPASPTGVLSMQCPSNANLTAPVGASGMVYTFTAPVATTTCPVGTTTVTQTSGPASGSTFPIGTTEICYQATDGCGNQMTCCFTVTVTAATPAPVLTMGACPNNVQLTVPFGSAGSVVTFDKPTATSTCAGGASVMQTTGMLSGSTFPIGVTENCFMASDACGNGQMCCFTVTIVESAPPSSVLMITPGAPQVLACGGSVTFSTPATSTTCPGGVVNLSHTDQVTGSVCSGFTHTRTFTATDACGNVQTAVEVITILPDDAPPTFTSLPPADLMYMCGDSINIGTATASDNCSSATVTHTVTNNGASDCQTINDILYGYDLTVTWVAIDGCGNSDTATTNIWVLPTGGIGFLGRPADKQIPCHAPVLFDQPMAKSFMAPIVSITHEDISDLNACGTGTITRIWTATDALGNTCQAEQVITILPDSQAPVMVFELPVTSVDCEGNIPVAPPFVTDNCSNELSVTFTDVQLSDKILRTWTATDPCGNQSTALQTIYLTDIVPPTFVTVPAAMAISCEDAVAFGQPTVADACTVASLSFEDGVIEGNCSATYTRTWTATDAAGNTSTAAQQISVADLEAPVFTTIPASGTVACTDDVLFGTPVAVDLCHTVILYHNDVITTPVCGNSGYTATRTWTANDGCNNLSQIQQVITVALDEQAPQFSVPVEPFVEMTHAEFTQLQLPAATDNCSIDPQVMFVINTVDACNFQVTYTAMDACGNLESAEQQIHITDGPCAPLSSDELELAQIQVYPNPTTGALFVKIPLSVMESHLEYAVYDALGRLIANQGITETLTTLYFDDLAAGSYFLKVSNGANTRVFKFVKIDR